MRTHTGSAHPRIGLLGNPSDGYGGRVLSLSFTNFRAEVTLSEDGPLASELFTRLKSGEADGFEALASAAARRFARSHPLDKSTHLHFTANTDIPRQAGLAGSSAVVTAALRALARRFGVSLLPRELALLAWEAETEELGIIAGPQDRVAQAHGGLLDMDFSKPWSAGSFRQLSPELLPPLLIAWDTAPGAPSGAIHDTVRARHAAGDPEVVRAMRRFPEIAAEGISALESGDSAKFLECMDANFDARAAIWTLSVRDQELISIARNAGCAAKFPGSGGAVVCAAPDAATLASAEDAYAARDLPTIRPTAAPLAPELSS